MLDSLLADLKQAPWYRSQITHIEVIPPSQAKPVTAPLHPCLKSYLDERGITLYPHQKKAIDAIRAGQDVIITTPTASGKTLAFNLPIVEALLADQQSCALYLYPLKALANDQLQKLRSLEQKIGSRLAPSTYDGDTPTSKRRRIKQTSRIILTNPHALHYYLPWHHQWRRFFQNLRYIVIDEAHTYRGVFGTNVALLLQRFFRLLSHYDASPQLILASASIANPRRYARDLTGRIFTAIAEDTSARGEKRIVFWDAAADPRHSTFTQAARILSFLTTGGLQTLCFTGSRTMAEVVASTAQTLGTRKILSYRAGYLPQERREIEAGLRKRQIDGVVTTNALEAGIDIGSLDAVILVGYPGSLISAWQQAGRAGRGTDLSLVVFMPHEDPLDRFFLSHPDRFLGRKREQIVIKTDNPRLQAGHLACAAAELPLHPEKVSPGEKNLLDGLTRKALLAKTARGYIYRGQRRAHELVSLNNISGETVKLICDGRLLETMDRLRACRDAYPGAVFLHRGESYVVERLDLENGIAEARQEDVDYSTKGLRTSSVDILTTEDTVEGASSTRGRGRVRVTESFIGYKTVHFNRLISVDPLDLPPYTYESDGLWVSFPEGTLDVESWDMLGGLHGAEHALIAMAPLLVLCDRDDVGGVSSPLHGQTACPTILIFDGIEGGAGLADVLYDAFDPLATEALRLVVDCPCIEGCPSCLYSPRCGHRNRPLSKKGAIHVLRQLAEGKPNGGENK